MKLASREIRFLGSTSPDVVTHKFYYAEAPNEVNYDSPNVDLGNDQDEEGYITADLAVLFPADIDGVYNVGIAAVDDAGNESSMSKAGDFPLDLVAPSMPGPIEIL